MTTETTTIVKFEESRNGGTMALINGKPSFPDRSGQQPNPGEIWEVTVKGSNTAGTVNFLQLLRKVELVQWQWNDGMGSRSMRPACLIVTATGEIHRFHDGTDIDGVVKVLKADYTKNGKWSHYTYTCASPTGTKVYSWMEDFDYAGFWPQGSWEGAYQAVQEKAPQVNAAALEAIIRKNWPEAASKFDANREALAAMAAMAAMAPELPKQEVGPTSAQLLDELVGELMNTPENIINVTREGDDLVFSFRDGSAIVVAAKNARNRVGSFESDTD